MIEFDLTKRELEPGKAEEFKRQRIERGFADCDWWDLNDYLLWLLPNILEVFLERSNGAPGGPGETAHELLSSGEEHHRKRREEWEKTLQEMIRHFRNASKFRGSFIGGALMGQLVGQATKEKELQEFLELLPPETLAAYESGDPKALDLHESLMDEISDSEMRKGFDMLKEHFWRLWD